MRPHGRGVMGIGILSILLGVSGAWAADWPRFGGPDGNNVARETGLMKTWPEGGPKVLWSAKLGPGFGSPAAEAGKVYILDRIAGQKDVLRCLDLKDGKEIWQFAYDAPGKPNYPGSRSTPTVDKELVFTIGPYGHLHAVSKTTHEPKWKANLLKDFGGKLPRWAVAQSPVVYGDTVIAIPNGSKAGVVAFEKNTGKVAWQSKPLQGGMSYASPVVTSMGGVDQVLAITTTQTVGVDAKSGKVLWKTGDWTCQIPIASAAPVGDGRIFVTGGYGAGAALFKVDKAGAGFNVKTLWKTKQCNDQIHSPVLYKDHLYLNGNDKAKKNGFMCMDLNGKVLWKTGRNPGFDWGGLLLADGMIYAVDGTKGDLCLIKPTPEKYTEVGRINVLSGAQIWAAIALADGKILCRDQKQLKCIDVRTKP